MDTAIFMLIFVGTAVGVSALGFELYSRQRAARHLLRTTGELSANDQESACGDPQTALEALRRACETRLPGKIRCKSGSRKAA